MKLFIQILSWTVGGLMTLGAIAIMNEGQADGVALLGAFLVITQCVVTLIYVHDIKEIKEPIKKTRVTKN